MGSGYPQHYFSDASGTQRNFTIPLEVKNFQFKLPIIFFLHYFIYFAYYYNSFYVFQFFLLFGYVFCFPFFDAWFFFNFFYSFLCEVAAQAEQNSMDMSNLASIFSPTLMRPPTDSESLQNAFQELRRSKSILNLLLVRADMKSEERRALEGNNGNDDDVTLKTPGSDNSSMENLSLENLHTNSALLSNSNNAE